MSENSGKCVQSCPAGAARNPIPSRDRVPGALWARREAVVRSCPTGALTEKSPAVEIRQQGGNR